MSLRLGLGLQLGGARRVDTAGGDPQFASVTYLAHADEADGSTSLTNLGSVPTVAIFNGGAAISNVNPRYGIGAVALDGSGDSFDLPNVGGALIDTTQPFTMDLSFYVTTSGRRTLVSNYHNSGGNVSGFIWEIGRNSGEIRLFGYQGSGTVSGIDIVAGGVVSLKTYHEARFSYDGTTYFLHLDGAAIGSGTGATIVLPSTNEILRYGLRTTDNFGIVGQIEEVRNTQAMRGDGGDYTVAQAAFPDSG